MPRTDPQTLALLAHVFQQTQANISFLAAQNYISPSEASDLNSRLTTAQSRAGTGPSPGPSTDDTFSNSMQNLNIRAVSPNNTGRRVPPPRLAPPPPRSVQKAKALWAYNEDGRESNDLSFSVGEIIEIVDETNTDWWTGKCRGRQGLFPSNHVEKIDSSYASTSPAPMPPMPVMSPPAQPMVPYQPQGPGQGYAPNYADEKQVYQPYSAPYPPPAPMGMAVAPAPAPQPVIMQEAPQQPKKNHRFGQLGNTMANAAAGGVGFGAGAAIGSGIIDAIF